MLLPVGPLPDDPLAASQHFHAAVLPQVLDALNGAQDHVTLVFAPADPKHLDWHHEDWRRAAVATLARTRAPQRVNGLAGADAAGLEATAAYIATAPGLTGQYLVVDAQGAG